MLNIIPIKFEDLSNSNIEFNIIGEPIDPNLFKVNIKHVDLEPGYIVKTNALENNIFIYFDKPHMKMFSTYNHIDNNGAFVHYGSTFSGDVTYLNLSNYYNSWPYYDGNVKQFNIIAVLKTNMNLIMFATKKDIADFFVKYKLNEL